MLRDGLVGIETYERDTAIWDNAGDGVEERIVGERILCCLDELILLEFFVGYSCTVFSQSLDGNNLLRVC
jgi:hypothetical protein